MGKQDSHDVLPLAPLRLEAAPDAPAPPGGATAPRRMATAARPPRLDAPLVREPSANSLSSATDRPSGSPRRYRRLTDADALGVRLGKREMNEVLLSRAEALPERERELLHAILEHGQSVASLARLAGLPARSLRREVRRILRRLQTREYLFVLSRLNQLPGTRRRVASACFIRGLSLRQAANELGMSFYGVRRHHDAIRALVEASA